MANQVVTLYAAGGFVSSNSQDMDICYNSVEIAAGAAGSGVNITNVDAGANLDFDGAKLTNVAQATDPGDAVVLDGTSKIPSGLLPALAITDVVLVADAAGLEALTDPADIQEGDVVIVADDSAGQTGTATKQAYIYAGGGAGDIDTNFHLLQSGGVISVNGQATAVVVLDADDLTYTQANPAHWTVADNSTIKDTLDEVGSRLFALEAASAGSDVRYFVATGLIGAKNVAVLLADGTMQRAALTTADATKQIAVYSGTTTLATGVSGAFYVRNGAQITGYSGLNTGAVQYAAAAGALTGVAPAFNAGDNVYRVGVALSTTEILFDARHIVEHA